MNQVSLFIACGALAAAFAQSAAAETRAFEVGAFSKVSASAGLKVEVAVGADSFVSAEGASEDLETLDIRVIGGTLDVGRKHGWSAGRSWRRSGEVVVTVRTPELNGVEASSGSTLIAVGASADTFTADSSSGADLEVSGSCGALTADASSGARLAAEALQCKVIAIDASSGASVTAFASEKATADASSGASVRISGAPEVVHFDSTSGGSARLVKAP